MKSIVVLVAMLGAAVMAQTPEATYLEARAALQKRDFDAALKILRPLAEGGLARAQSTLGGMYASGLGVPQSYTEAVGWFQKSAAQGFAEGETNLGIATGNGQGIAKDEAKAAALFRKAADQGYAPGEYYMGNMYRFGTGVKQSPEDALSWYRKAAEKAFPKAWTGLGEMYDKGEGVLIDPVESYKWLVLAAVQGDQEAKQYIAGVAAKMTPAQIEDGKKAAVEWSKSHTKAP
jgi:TPR repeat protein